jgi:hypothetical protein
LHLTKLITAEQDARQAKTKNQSTLLKAVDQRIASIAKSAAGRLAPDEYTKAKRTQSPVEADILDDFRNGTNTSKKNPKKEKLGFQAALARSGLSADYNAFREQLEAEKPGVPSDLLEQRNRLATPEAEALLANEAMTPPPPPPGGAAATPRGPGAAAAAFGAAEGNGNAPAAAAAPIAPGNIDLNSGDPETLRLVDALPQEQADSLALDILSNQSANQQPPAILNQVRQQAQLLAGAMPEVILANQVQPPTPVVRQPRRVLGGVPWRPTTREQALQNYARLHGRNPLDPNRFATWAASSVDPTAALALE